MRTVGSILDAVTKGTETMRQATKTAFCLSFVLFFSAFLHAQGPSDAELRKSAEDAYAAKDWNSSAKLYDSLTKSDPANPRYWYRLAISAKSIGEYDKALGALSKAEAAGTPKQLVAHARALTLASKGDNDGAFRELKVSVDSGFSDPDLLASEAEFAPLRNDARFTAAVDQARHNLTPCKYTPENRQFDFWIGEWNAVVSKDGSPAGDSRIELSLGDCVIVENWTSKNSPYAGKSYNGYNVGEKRWEQFWVDNSQGMIQFFGNLKDGVMDFYTADNPQPDGTTLKRHLQFIPQGPDTVRQFSQGSTDHGKTWTVEYDFIYHRKKP
jgi:hypothetical protein